MIPLPLIQGATLTNSTAIYYRVPTTDQRLKSVKLTSLRVCNTDTMARTFTLYVVPPGGSAGVENTRFKTISVEAAGGADSSAYFLMSDVLLPGTTIQASASVSGALALSVNGEQYP